MEQDSNPGSLRSRAHVLWLATGGGQSGLELNPSQAVLSLVTWPTVRWRALMERSPAGLEDSISTRTPLLVLEKDMEYGWEAVSSSVLGWARNLTNLGVPRGVRSAPTNDLLQHKKWTFSNKMGISQNTNSNYLSCEYELPYLFLLCVSRVFEFSSLNFCTFE